MVLVHGAGASSRYVIPAHEQLAAHCRVYARPARLRRQRQAARGARRAAAGRRPGGLHRGDGAGPACAAGQLHGLPGHRRPGRTPNWPGPVSSTGRPSIRRRGPSWARGGRLKNARREPASLQEVGKQMLRCCGRWRLFWTALRRQGPHRGQAAQGAVAGAGGARRPRRLRLAVVGRGRRRGPGRRGRRRPAPARRGRSPPRAGPRPAPAPVAPRAGPRRYRPRRPSPRADRRCPPAWVSVTSAPPQMMGLPPVTATVAPET